MSARSSSSRCAAAQASKVQHEIGQDAVSRRLGELEVSPDGTTSLRVDPEHIEVDSVQAEMQIQLGARQYAGQRKAYEDYLDELGKAESSSATPEELRARLERIEEELRREELKRRGLASLDAVSEPVQNAFKRTVFPPLALLGARSLPN